MRGMLAYLVGEPPRGSEGPPTPCPASCGTPPACGVCSGPAGWSLLSMFYPAIPVCQSKSSYIIQYFWDQNPGENKFSIASQILDDKFLNTVF